MLTQVSLRVVGVAVVLTALGCNDEKKPEPAAQASAAALASAAPAAAPVAAAPAGCKAAGSTPTVLGTVVGDVHGFAADATQLYYATWQVYGGRGDVGAVRKDGKGARGLVGLELEPRGLAADDKNVFFTSGIRLVGMPKAGGATNVLHQQFSSQSIALDDANLYGVPGDYGPYDRVNKIDKKGGEATELSSSPRPKGGDGLTGYNRVRVDGTGVYVADAGGRRVLKLPLAGGKATSIASTPKSPFDLVLGATNAYFSLVDGDLMAAPKAGGKAAKLASGLVPRARIAGDDTAVYATFAGKSAGAPATLFRVSAKDGTLTALSPIPDSQTVDAMELDGECVYWVQRVDASKSVVYAMPR